MGAADRRAKGDRAAGLLSTSFGLLFFLGFLFFAVQLTFNLYATSVVTSAAYDAARRVATASQHPPTDEQLDLAVAHARAVLGRYGDNASFEWDLSDPDVVRLRVRAVNPRFLAPPLDVLVGHDVVDRTVVVRVEQVR